ncbi:MAG: DoxX family membrane protein [Phycisphaerae bacterium]|nr:DoxX family membrane protein [Phycisphaerae bacterium]
MANAPAIRPAEELLDTRTPRIDATFIFLQYLPRLIVAAVFLYAAYLKIFSEKPDTFAREIAAYKLAPLQVTHLMALGLPWLELICAAALVVGLWVREARLWLLLMLVGFTPAKVYALVSGLKISCGCVPANSPLKFLFDGWPGVATNVVLIALLLLDGWAGWSRRRRS